MILERYARELLLRSGEHLLLVVIALAAASCISIPLGIWVAHSPRWRSAVLGAAGVLQTIPGLALLGLLLALPIVGGIGNRPALVALTLYSILPILRNTVVGIEGIDPPVREAAVGLGMTAGQILREVELPLAAPVILAGVRTSAVTCIGLATIAAAIGAGGLGVFIFRGISVVDNRLLLLGAIPAMGMAICADVLFSYIERRVSR